MFCYTVMALKNDLCGPGVCVIIGRDTIMIDDDAGWDTVARWLLGRMFCLFFNLSVDPFQRIVCATANDVGTFTLSPV